MITVLAFLILLGLFLGASLLLGFILIICIALATIGSAIQNAKYARKRGHDLHAHYQRIKK